MPEKKIPNKVAEVANSALTLVMTKRDIVALSMVCGTIIYVAYQQGKKAQSELVKQYLRGERRK